MRLKSFDNLLMALMSFVACLSLYMLYGVKLLPRSSSHELSVARITDQINTVKRKKDFYQSWKDADVGEGLAQNDEVYTHGQSSAKIHFNNGPEVELYENSLLKIKANNVALEKGNLTAKLTPQAGKLNILLNGKQYSFESDKASIQIEQGQKENKFVVTDGDAHLKLGEKLETIRPNQVVIQDKNSGEIKVKQIPFALIAPASGHQKYFAKDTPVRFEWSFSQTPPSPVRLLVARDSSFENILLEETVEATSYETSFKDEGTFFWKIVSRDDISSPLRSLTLKKERPLLLKIDKNIIYKGPKKSENVTLHWPKSDARHFELKIKNEQEKILDLDDNFYDFQASQTGETLFSVRVKDPARPEALWSHPVALEVREEKSISITSGLPEVVEKINYTQKGFIQLLSWNGPSSGIVYKITVHQGGEEKIFTTESLSYPLPLINGETSWSVQGETESGVMTNTISGKIRLKAPLRLGQTPSEGAVIELEKPDQTISFNWSPSGAGSEVYAFELSGDPAFSKIMISKETSSPSTSTTIAQTGRYFWRVKLKKGQTEEYSEPVSVEIRPAPPLSRPEIAPEIKIKMKTIEEKSSFLPLLNIFIARAEADEMINIAEWDVPANNRAKTYIVEVYQDKTLGKLLAKIESSTPHIVWKKAVSGTFYWRMCYEDFWGRRTDFSQVAVLETSVDEEALKKIESQTPPEPLPGPLPPPPIDLVSPKHREMILKQLGDKAEFSWEGLPEVKTYLFTLSRDLDFKTSVVTKKTTQTTIELSCEDLKSQTGDFYWKVSADNGSTSKRRIINTECRPPVPPAPVIVEEKAPVEKSTEPLKTIRPTTLLRAELSPQHLSYTNKASNYAVDVSGNVINSLGLFYQRPVSWKWFSLLSSEAQLQRGKVFQQLTFTDGQFSVRFHHTREQLHFGPVISLLKKTVFLENQLAIIDQSQLLPMIGAFIRYDFPHVQASSEVKAGGALDVQAEILYHWSKKYAVGPFAHLSSFTKEGGKHQFSAFGVKFSYALFFDETK